MNTFVVNVVFHLLPDVTKLQIIFEGKLTSTIKFYVDYNIKFFSISISRIPFLFNLDSTFIVVLFSNQVGL